MDGGMPHAPSRWRDSVLNGARKKPPFFPSVREATGLENKSNQGNG